MGIDNIIAPIVYRRRGCAQWAFALVLLLATSNAFAVNMLFIGNSFTFGYGSAVRYYRSQTVTDLNGGGQGGVPALFTGASARSVWWFCVCGMFFPSYEVSKNALYKAFDHTDVRVVTRNTIAA